MDIKQIFTDKGLRVEQRTIGENTIYTMVDPIGTIKVREEVLLKFCKQLVNSKKPKRKPAPKKPAEEPKEVKSVKKKSKS